MYPNPKIVYIVVLSLSGAMFGGMYATYTLIMEDRDAALIAIMSGFTGTALGGLLSILNRTGSTAESSAPIKTEVISSPDKPVNVVE